MMNEQLVLEENRKLKELLAAKDATIVSKESEIKEGRQQISALQQEVLHLNEQVEMLKLLHFGPKSEKWTKEDEKQARLFNEAEDTAFQQDDEEEQKKVIDTREIGPHIRRIRKCAGRTAIPKDFPREELEYDIPEEEKICACGAKKKEIGEDVSERIKIIPAKIVVIKEKRKKYACKSCEGTAADEPGVVTAEGVRHLISRSIADESFLAWSAIEKFEFALPFYRQAKRLAHIGLKIPRATLSNLTIKAGLACKPLYELMQEYIRSGPLINADETRLQVLDEPNRKATDLSWMWVFLGGPPDKKSVVFQYEQGRSSDIAQAFLDGYKGYLQTDDFGAYHTAVRALNKNRCEEEKIKHILCWNHSRSKFYKAWEVTKSEHAQKAIKLIKELFELEKLRTQYSKSGFRKQRKNKAQLIFDRFKPWLEKLYYSTPPKSLLGKAIIYTLDNWEQLITYVDDPDLTPSNNLAENAIRPYVIGRKNWLFSGTPAGAEASAIIYSLIESAKLNDLNPYDYLYHIFRKLPYATKKSDYYLLLPSSLKQEDL